MPRYRSIRGEERADDPVFAQASWGAIFFYDQLMCYVDDKGRKKNYPSALAGELFPRREDITPKQIREWIEEWVTLGRIKLYEVAGIPYLWMCNMVEEQNIDRPGRSKLPPHPEDPECYQGDLFESEGEGESDIRESVASVSRESREGVAIVSRESREGVERVSRSRVHDGSIGVKENYKNNPPLPPADFETWFEEFDRIYPSRGGGAEQRVQAKAFLLKLNRGGADLAAVLDGCRRFRAWADHAGKTGRDEGIPSMLNWVKGERWREAYNFKNGQVSPPKPGRKREPEAGVDFYVKPIRIPVDANGEECDEGGFEFVKFKDIPARFCKRNGVETDERWYREVWEREQLEVAAA